MGLAFKSEAKHDHLLFKAVKAITDSLYKFKQHHNSRKIRSCDHPRHTLDQTNDFIDENSENDDGKEYLPNDTFYGRK